MNQTPSSKSVEEEGCYPRWVWLPVHTLSERNSVVEALGSQEHHKGASSEVQRCSWGKKRGKAKNAAGRQTTYGG